MALLIAAAATDSTALSTLGAVLALAGLWLWEDLWVGESRAVGAAELRAFDPMTR